MIKLAKNQVEEMFAHAREEFPQECCGLLGGRGDLTNSVYRLNNIAPNPQIEYEAASAELFKAQHEMRSRGEKLIGIYHSHPAQAEPLPSETDVRRAFYRDAFYFIIGCAGSEYILRAFRLYEDNGYWEAAEFVVLE